MQSDSDVPSGRVTGKRYPALLAVVLYFRVIPWLPQPAVSGKILFRVIHVTNWQFCAFARVGAERVLVSRGSVGFGSAWSGVGTVG